MRNIEKRGEIQIGCWQAIVDSEGGDALEQIAQGCRHLAWQPGTHSAPEVGVTVMSQWGPVMSQWRRGAAIVTRGAGGRAKAAGLRACVSAAW